MTTRRIIELLKGHDSKNPLAFGDLVNVIGLQPSTLQMVLDNMFSSIPTPINRAEITRGGVSQFYYWPTGVVSDIDFSISKKRPYFPPHRRSEDAQKPKAQPAHVQEPPAIKTQENIMPNEGKSYARIMLEYLAEHGFATNAKLLEVSGAACAKPFLKHKIALGLIIKDGMNYRLADGVTAEQLLADARKNNVPPHMAQKQNRPPEQDEAAAKCQEQQESLSNVVDFKRAEAAKEEEPTREFTSHDVFLDATGQLNIKLPGKVRMVFPVPDTKRIKTFLAAVDLEALCV